MLIVVNQFRDEYYSVSTSGIGSKIAECGDNDEVMKNRNKMKIYEGIIISSSYKESKWTLKAS